jgi:hypothetical protein
MRRRPATLLIACALLLTSTTALGRTAVSPPTAAELRATVEALTAPGMDGRRAGTAGGDRATARLAAWLADAGLRPGGDAGTFLQSFVVSAARRVVGPGTVLEIDGRSLQAGVDWTPHGGSRTAAVAGQLVVVDEDWGGDLRGAVVVGPPRGSRLETLILARQRGAAAALLVADALPALDATAPPVDIASGTLTRAAAAALPRRSGQAKLMVDFTAAEVRAANVIGIVPGTDPALAGEAVVVGAHWDHLGASGGDVFHGADDNASGTAVVVGLARAFAAAGGPRRTLVFALFGAEELGLIGSGHYVRHPALPLAQTVAMLNFDMVGRLRDDRLTIGGVQSGDRLRAAVTAAAQRVGVATELRDSPFSPSDHTRFYSAGLPVLFFHTGGHSDYHRPSDTADKLDVDGMGRVAAVGAATLTALDEGARPVYAKLSRPPGRGGGGATGGAMLGVGGDGLGGDGARLARVLPGSAAERAGLRDGDVLVRVGAVTVDSFDALRAAIRARQPGDTVRLVYLRDGRDHETTATLEGSQR